MAATTKLIIGVPAHKYIENKKVTYSRPLTTDDCYLTCRTGPRAKPLFDEGGKPLTINQETIYFVFNGKTYPHQATDRNVSSEPAGFFDYLKTTGLTILSFRQMNDKIEETDILGLWFNQQKGLNHSLLSFKEIEEQHEKAKELLVKVGIAEEPKFHIANYYVAD